MFALFSRILKLSGRYKSRIQGAFVCAFLESILSKMPIFLAFVVLSGFASKTITGQTCLYVGSCAEFEVTRGSGQNASCYYA
jgi:ATP-binding cassette, subfamily B, bacterial IrtB/YbtQ